MTSKWKKAPFCLGFPKPFLGHSGDNFHKISTSKCGNVAEPDKKSIWLELKQKKAPGG